MGEEIERKFLVKSGVQPFSSLKGIKYRQGYLNSDKERTVRVRIAGNRGYLTVKGTSVNISRLEYEYEIPVQETEEMLNKLCEKPIIEKKRYKVEYGGFIWEVDEFFGENTGLIVAEIELKHEGQLFKKPHWLGEEVTGDPRYYNSSLIKHPFTQW